MKVRLYKRHYGVHSLVKECEVEGTFRRYGKKIDGVDSYKINEERFLNALPEKFLPIEAKKVLLTVSEEWGSTAISELNVFRPWAKYFDSYSIELVRKE